MTRVWAQSQHKGSALLLLLAIADNANEDGVAWPSQETLAAKTRMSARQIRRLTDQFIESGELAVEERRNGRSTRLVYRFASPGQDVLVNGRSPGQIDPVHPDIAVSAEPSVVEQPKPITPSSEQVWEVVKGWKLYAPPLIDHRDAYFRDDKTVAAIKRALRTYPVRDVRNAIFNYATVLDGRDWRWDHHWTIIDFLKRGLDRFVDEARPLENFRIRAEGTKFGRRDVSAREMIDAAERLDREEIERAPE
jgi:hypothetical protein